MLDKKNKLNKLLKNELLRYLFYIFIILVIWQLVFMAKLFPEIMFPSVPSILKELLKEILDLSIVYKLLFSIKLILLALVLSTFITIILVAISMYLSTFRGLIDTLISIFDPLPSIAILPLAILWFGIGNKVLIFIMIHSILWPMLLNIISGFDSVPEIYKEVGKSIGLKGYKFLLGVYIPASIPNILTGFKMGWSRAWRALISAEMVFGATGAIGGLGWDIYIKRSYLDMPGMLTSLIIIMLVGVLVEKIIFKKIENKTIKKWGMIS